MPADLFRTTVAGSLPKPAWLAEPEKLWPQWREQGRALADAKRDATILWLKLQENAGIDIVSDGEQSRIHFVHGFLEKLTGIDWERKTKMGIRDNRYVVDVPTVIGPLGRAGPVHDVELRIARAHTDRQLKFTLPGPMTICDTIADAHYGKRADMAMALAEILNAEALALEALGADVIQFDEPAFNVFMSDVREWGVAALERASRGLNCRKAVHICYGYGIDANNQWKKSLGAEWRQYEQIFPVLEDSKIDQVSLECAGSRVPLETLALLKTKDVLLGSVDVADLTVESPEQVAAVISGALKYVDAERIFPCTNCGMAPLSREVAEGKLKALAAGARLARGRM